MMASKPPSGTSLLAEMRCLEMIWLNMIVLLVRDRTCLYPKVGGQTKSPLLEDGGNTHSGKQTLKP